MTELNEYALYKGEDLLAIGTIKEIADKMKVGIRTIYFYQTPTYKNRGKDNRRVLVKLEGEEDDE